MPPALGPAGSLAVSQSLKAREEAALASLRRAITERLEDGEARRVALLESRPALPPQRSQQLVAAAKIQAVWRWSRARECLTRFLRTPLGSVAWHKGERPR